jgi:broad specificity phosphatase PhoE
MDGAPVVLLMRHGETDWPAANALGLPGIAADWAPLTAVGEAQVAAAAERIAAEGGADVVVSSPMTRAMQSAAIVARRLDAPLRVEMDLREWLPDAGYMWHGPETPTVALEQLRTAGGEWPDGVPQPWEPLSALRARVVAALRRHRDVPRLVAVCHEVVIHSLTGEVTTPLAGIRRWEH